MAKKITSQLIANGLVTDFETGAVRSSGLQYPFLTNRGYPADDRLAKLYTENVWVYRAIQMRADALASIPWEVQRKFKNGNMVILKDSDAVVQVLSDVNPAMNWSELIIAIESDLLIYGRAFILKIRGENSRDVLALLRLNPTTVSVVAKATGIEKYVQTLSGVSEDFSVDDVIYFHTYSPVDDLGSVSTLAVARSFVEASNSTMTTIDTFFKNAAIPAVLLTTEQDIDEDTATAIKSRWERMFKGVSRWFKTAVLGKGVKAQVLSASPKEWALHEIDDATRTTIAGAFGIPPTILGASESANYATANIERKLMFENSVIPRAQYIASVFNAELLPEFGVDLEFVWLFENVPALQENEDAKVERYVKLVDAGIITPQTAAKELGYEVAETPTVVTKPETDDLDFVKSDIKKWHVKAKKRLQAGKGAACGFNSEHIPPSVMEAIKAQLEEVTDVVALTDIFNDAMKNIKLWSNYP